MPSVWDIIKPDLDGPEENTEQSPIERQEDTPRGSGRGAAEFRFQRPGLKSDKRLIELPVWEDD